MKWITAVALLILLVITPTIYAKAENRQININSIKSYKDIPGITAEEIAAIEKLKENKVHFTYGNLIEMEVFKLPDGTYSGFMSEYRKIFSELFGIAFVKVPYDSWQQMKKDVDSRKIDFTGDLTLNPERLREYYTTKPIVDRMQTIYTLAGSDKIKKETDVNGLRLGFLENSVNLEYILTQYPGLSFEAVPVDYIASVERMLVSGKIDGFVTERNLEAFFEDNNLIQSRDIFPLASTPFCLMTANPELKPIITVLNKYLVAGGIDKLYEYYKEGMYAYKKYKLFKSFTPEEIAYLDSLEIQNAKVKVGFLHDAYPVSFYNKTDKKFQGIALDILTEINKLTGLQFRELSAAPNITLAEILTKLKSGEVSMSTQLLYTESRKGNYLWSNTPYLSTSYALLSKIDTPHLAIYQVSYKKVGTIKETAYEEKFHQWFPGHEYLTVYDTGEEAFDALEKGEVDLLMLSESLLLTQTNYREKPGFKINIGFNATLDSYFGFNKNQTMLRSIIDKTLVFVHIDSITNEWLNRKFDYDKRISKIQTTYLAGFAISAFIVIVIMTFLLLTNKRLSKKLMTRTTMLSAIYESIPDTVFSKNTEGVYTSCNPSFEKQAGMLEDELIGKTYAEVFKNRVSETVELYKEIDKKVMTDRSTEITEEMVTYPDGSRKLLETVKAPLIQNGNVVGLLGLGRDVTGVRASQQSLQAVLDALPMPIRIVDLETDRIVYVNGSLLELLEYESPDEVCGLCISDILPDTMLNGMSTAERVNIMRQTENPVSIEINYRTKKDKIIEALVVTRQIDYRGKRSSIGIIKDLTAEKEHARILLNAVEREKEANQTKSLFLANMSHEIRTPMNGIIGMADLLLGENLSTRQLQYVKDVKMSAESLLGIINDILDLSKISEGKLPIVQVDVELCTLLENTVSMMRFSAQSKGLHFIDEIQINSPEYVRVDDIRLKQILVNLLSNAIKFTKTGHVKLLVKLEDGNIEFEVSDTGVGIKQEEIPLIFMAFEQADRRKNRSIKGTGLGLSISKNLVELMGGQIWAESEYDVGTTFHVKIPHIPGDESAVEVIEAGFEYISAPTAQILLVDDIQTNLTVGAGLLRMCGITADVAVSGHESIELVKAKDYDIVFMDHMMPEMDGIEAMNAIRDMGGKYCQLPIIALTANAVNESREFLLSSGMNDFLSKPIDKAALMNILKKWLPAHKVEFGIKIDRDNKSEPYPEALAAAAKIPGIDIELALSRINNMYDVLEDSINQTAQLISGRLKKMDTYLSDDDLRGFSIESHALKSALASIGATHNSELAAELEIASKAENMPLCKSKFIVFADVMESFAEELKAIFPQTKTADKPRGDDKFLALKVGETVVCLKNYETEEALKNLEELDKLTFGEKTDATLNEARSVIKTFKYKKAISLLEELMRG